MRRGVIVLLLLLVAATATVVWFRIGPAGSPGPVADTAVREPGPGDPPLVWVPGTLQEIAPSHITLREGDEGPEVRMQRLAGQATKFLAERAGDWRELAVPEADALESGTPACVEAFLDGRVFLALRVFIDAACGPAGPA